MENIKDLEVFHIEITDEGCFAYLSYQDEKYHNNMTNGYNHIRVPMNLRPIQLSSRGNTLVNQSIKNDVDVPNVK